MIATIFNKPLIISAMLAALLFGVTALMQSGQAYASGGASSSPAPSRGYDAPRQTPEQRRIDRLYDQGRKVFRRKVSCDDGCLVADDVINNNNAADFLLAIHNQPRFKEALEDEEIQAVSVYMLRRYDIKIE